MADDVKAGTTNQTDATPAPVALNAETTLSKDSELSINKADAAVPPPAIETPIQPTPAAPVAPQPVDYSISTPTPTAPTEPLAEPLPTENISVPVVVSEQEAKAADNLEEEKPADTQGLEGQVETLTGEIQSLESKIERLTSNASTPTDSKAAVKPTVSPVVEPPRSIDPVVKAENAPKPPMPVTPPPKPADLPAFNKPTEKSAVATFSDIFPKQAEKLKTSDHPTAGQGEKSLGDAPAVHHSPLTVIGEVLSVFGVVVLAALFLGPFYQQIIGSSLYGTIKSIGWIVAPASLLLGFLFLLFSKGKWMLKILIFILLLITLAFYWGLNGSGAVADQINSFFGVIISFYR